MKTDIGKIALVLTVLALWVYTLHFAATRFGPDGFQLALLLMAVSSAITELRK